MAPAILPSSDLFLRLGLTLARALCIRQQRHRDEDAVDFAEIERAVQEVEKQTELLGGVDTLAQTIKNNCEKICERVAASRKSLERQVSVLNERLSALKHLAAQDDSDAASSSPTLM